MRMVCGLAGTALAFAVASAAAPPAADSGAPPDLALVGVVQIAQAGRASAIVRSGGRSRVAAVGETAFGGRVIAIGADSVKVQFASGPVELRLAAPQGRQPAPAPALTTVEPPAADFGAAQASRSMARAEVERRLAQEAPRLLAETALVPVSEDGRTVGFALSRLPEGSLLTDAGLRAGDVLTEVNGVAIDSLATLAALYARLQNESELRAVVLRNGAPVTLTVAIR